MGQLLQCDMESRYSVSSCAVKLLYLFLSLSVSVSVSVSVSASVPIFISITWYVYSLAPPWAHSSDQSSPRKSHSSSLKGARKSANLRRRAGASGS